LIDGLAVSVDGIAYMVPDDNTPLEIYAYDIIGGAYLASLTSPWNSSDTFSGGAYISNVVPVELQSFGVE
jgi:hypothetical protein